jgi:hypothetical protein
VLLRIVMKDVSHSFCIAYYLRTTMFSSIYTGVPYTVRLHETPSCRSGSPDTITTTTGFRVDAHGTEAVLASTILTNK